jgi:hypothetical protein
LINADAGVDLASRRLKVLFAEDEVLLRLMLCDVLRESGFQVFEAADAALRTTPVDVVITDLLMRVVGDGIEFARHVGAHCPGVASANERPSYSGPTRAATLSGGAIVGGIVVILIVREQHRRVSTPNDRRSKPSTVGTSHDPSWTRQHWINAAQRARILGRRSGSCMERSCVRSHHSGHRCCGTRHLVRPRRVSRKMPSG